MATPQAAPPTSSAPLLAPPATPPSAVDSPSAAHSLSAASIFGGAPPRSTLVARAATAPRRLALVPEPDPALAPSAAYDPAADEALAAIVVIPRIDLATWTPIAGPADAAIVAILAARLADGESATDGFARKERELLAVFSTLQPIDSLYLERRLESPLPNDTLAHAFRRLTVARRTRLLASLFTSRRRPAAR